MANGKELKLLDNAELVSLARYASENGVSELEWCDGEARILLKLKPGRSKFRAASAIEAQPEQPRPEAVRAPSFGEFHQPENLLIDDEMVVNEGQILAFVRLGPVMKAIRAPRRGTLKSCGYHEKALVGYGDVVFQITPQQGGAR
ncbi:biotin carboxyl carrier protein [Neorhizobium galegae]|uniref:hypothetical protein n=1 Tax=Neorhizobium galegae TaxID=399 RepID=UPI0027884005|nr:hypothetical protein [Neorhizobium galegae]MDQ0137641.1 biotin carboxyl carrier protein [Neorhizobium galegae]